MPTNYKLDTSRTIKEKKDVSAKFKVSVNYTQKFEDTAEDKAIHAYFTKNALTRIDKLLDKLVSPFETAMNDAQAKLESIQKKIDNIGDGEGDKLVKELTEFESFLKTANQLLEQGKKSIDAAVAAEIAAIEADAVAAAKKQLRNNELKKTFVKTLKVVVVGTITVAVAATGIAATVATAGTAAAAIAAAVSVVATVAGTAITINQSLKDDWQSESKIVGRIEKYYGDLKDMTAKLKGELDSLEQYQKNTQKALQEQTKTLADLATKFNGLALDSAEQKKIKQKVKADITKAESVMKTLQEHNKELTELIKTGRQTIQYLGPLGAGAAQAANVKSKLGQGLKFIIDQTGTAVTIRDNAVNLSDAANSTSVIVKKASDLISKLK